MHGLKRWTGRLITLGGIGLAGLILSLFVQLETPPPTGSHAVGRTAVRWVDVSRPETLTPFSDDHRETVAEIWYPAKPQTGTPVPYMPDLNRIAQGLRDSGEVTPLEVFGLRLVRSRNRLGAEVSAAQAKYPLVLFSPGNGTNVEFYSAIAEELASHGYVVVGINHPYDVAAVALADGGVVQFAANAWPRDFSSNADFATGRIAIRTQDVLFVLDRLAALGDHPLAGRLDLSRVGVMGHSLGGITAAEACRWSPRFKACLNLDGLQRGGPFSAQADPPPISQPFMFITKEPRLSPKHQKLFQPGNYRVVVAGARHDHFTDGPLLEPSLLPLPNQADQVLRVTRDFTLAFFDQSLRSQSSQLLAKPFQTAQVSLEVYGPE